MQILGTQTIVESDTSQEVGNDLGYGGGIDQCLNWSIDWLDESGPPLTAVLPFTGPSESFLILQKYTNLWESFDKTFAIFFEKSLGSLLPTINAVD